MSTSVDVEMLPCKAGGPNKLKSVPAHEVGARYMYYNVCWKCGLTEREIRNDYAEQMADNGNYDPNLNDPATA